MLAPEVTLALVTLARLALSAIVGKVRARSPSAWHFPDESKRLGVPVGGSRRAACLVSGAPAAAEYGRRALQKLRPSLRYRRAKATNRQHGGAASVHARNRDRTPAERLDSSINLPLGLVLRAR